MSDEETHSAPAETEAIEAGETQGLAWSQANLEHVTPFVQRRRTMPWVAAVVGIVVLAAGAYLIGQHHNQPLPKPAPSAAPVEPSSPSPSSSVVAAPPVAPIPEAPPFPTLRSAADRDATYLALLDRADIHFASNDVAIYNAHVVCEALERGDSIDTVIADNKAKSPLVTWGQVGKGVRAAIVAYCPQYEK